MKGERGHEPVFRALDLVDYKSCFSGFKKALIKVNFICNETWESGATTDPIVVEAIIKKLRDLPLEIFVVESDATMTNADKAYEATGMKEMCQRNGVEFLNLRYQKDKVKIPIPDCETLGSIKVPRIVTESAVISAAKMKTHMATKVTLGMKNMFGLLPDKLKFKYHAQGMSKVVVDINTVIKPALTVIDGFVAMEGHGPTGAPQSKWTSSSQEKTSLPQTQPPPGSWDLTPTKSHTYEQLPRRDWETSTTSKLSAQNSKT